MCVDGDHNKHITLGKIYEGVRRNDGYRLLAADNGEPRWYYAERFEIVTEEPRPAKGTQVGGSHYTKCGIQPYEYTLANNLGGLEHTIVKYVTRWKDKGGVEDLKKARHTLDFLIEYQENNDR